MMNPKLKIVFEGHTQEIGVIGSIYSEDENLIKFVSAKTGQMFYIPKNKISSMKEVDK